MDPSSIPLGILYICTPFMWIYFSTWPQRFNNAKYFNMLSPVQHETYKTHIGLVSYLKICFTTRPVYCAHTDPFHLNFFSHLTTKFKQIEIFRYVFLHCMCSIKPIINTLA
jgi:hypothetical protein